MRKVQFAPIGALTYACVLSVCWTALVSAQDLTVAVGSATYSSDAFCLTTSAALSSAYVGVGGGAVGVSASYSNGNWPWPDPPPPPPGGLVVPGAAFSLGIAQDDHAYFLTHGDAFRAMAEVFPHGLIPGLRESSATLRQYFKPFVGVGAQISTDGEAAPAGVNGDEPTYSVQGSTDLLVAYGAAVNAPISDRVALHVQFRGNTLFAGDVELLGPAGERLISEDQRLNWGEWLIGFNFGF